MKVEKKLKRGLPDISPLFLKEEMSSPAPIKKPVDDSVCSPKNPEAQIQSRGFVSLGIFPFGDEVESSHLRILLKQFSLLTNEVTIVSPYLEKNARSLWGGRMNFREHDGREFLCESSLEHVRVTTLSWEKLRGVMRLDRLQEHQTAAFARHNSLKRSFQISEQAEQGRIPFVVLDVSPEGGVESTIRLNLERETIHMVDQCILMVGGSSDSLRQAYEWLKFSTSEHPKLISSLLICGTHVENHWEFIFEKFHEFVSRFLGYELEFLGWISGQATQMNSDLLLELGTSPGLSHIKTQLGLLLAESESLAA